MIKFQYSIHFFINSETFKTISKQDDPVITMINLLANVKSTFVINS